MNFKGDKISAFESQTERERTAKAMAVTEDPVVPSGRSSPGKHSPVAVKRKSTGTKEFLLT